MRRRGLVRYKGNIKRRALLKELEPLGRQKLTHHQRVKAFLRVNVHQNGHRGIGIERLSRAQKNPHVSPFCVDFNYLNGAVKTTLFEQIIQTMGLDRDDPPRCVD